MNQTQGIPSFHTWDFEKILKPDTRNLTPKIP
jgi:hypothetical protein